MIQSARNKSDKENGSDNLQDYLLSSSLHGLRYIGTVALSVFERFFFGVSFLMVMCLAAYFITNLYQKWEENPVIVSLDPVATDIKDIPFPAVTICNMNQVQKSYANAIKTQQERLMLESVCRQDGLSNETTSNGKWSFVRDFLMDSSQSCEEMIKMCKFGTEKYTCSLVFMSVLTDEGLCCSFNFVHPKLLFKGFDEDENVDSDHDKEVEYKTWSPEGGYIKSNMEPYPFPVPGAGSKMGLTLILNADLANYYCSSTSSSGFKVLLHSPIETPRISNFGFSVSPGLETKVVITPKISQASENIRGIPISKRRCIFANEANLSYYNIYSKKNCEMECSSKILEETCNCTLYYMPMDNRESVICNRKKAECYEKVLYNIASTRNEEFSCNYCLPACFEVNYGREISTARLGAREFMTSETLPTSDLDFIKNNLAILHIYFLDNSYVGFTKNELIGFTEFLSSTGGLLGLFMGFSVISLIEIIYFLSLRPYCARKRNKVQDDDDKFHPRKSQIFKGNNFGKTYSNEYRCEQQRERTLFNGKLTNELRKMWKSVKNGWKTFLDLFKNENEDLPPPYPFYN